MGARYKPAGPGPTARVAARPKPQATGVSFQPVATVVTPAAREERAVSAVAGWFLIGVPALVAGLAMFAARGRALNMAAYGVLAVGSVALTAVHRPSGALLGGLLALLYATGRGGAAGEGHAEPGGRDEGEREATG